MRTLRISVRRLVEFILRSGDIDSDRDRRGGIEAMLAGGEIHRLLQASAGDSYQAEVSLAGSIFFPSGAFSPHAARLDIREEAMGGQDGFFLCIEGRADGIIDDGKRPPIIDEIKGVTRDITAIEEPEALHEAQALCYAYLYLRSTRGASALATAFSEHVAVRLTYASMTSGEVRQIERSHSVPDIEAWFFSLLEKAQRWAAWRVRHDELRNRTLERLAFPFAMRNAQREIVDAVSATIHNEGRLYLQAPTGSGKTVATLYPALKAMGAGEVSRIAFLTAKTMTRNAALECLELFRNQGLSANVLVMTARDKICPLRGNTHGADVRARPLVSLCNPVECPLARGHYDSVNDALFEAIDAYDTLDATSLAQVGAHHHVCPYELQRDAALWADIIVCDYHYAFAPSASLVGLSDEAGTRIVFLVDEAHNLAERMRDMYSAELSLSELTGLERLLRKHASLNDLRSAVHAVVQAFPKWDKALPTNPASNSRGRGRPVYQRVHIDEALSNALTALADSLDDVMEDISPDADGMRTNASHTRTASTAMAELYLALRDTQLATFAFIGALQRSETGYASFLGLTGSHGTKLKIYCVDPSSDLEARLEQAKAAVFFSGTLLPMDYHRKLLAAREEDATIYAKSSFDPTHRQVLIGTDISARFSRRGPELYGRIASYLLALMRAQSGNYLVFLPSYAMLAEVASALEPLVNDKTMVVRQQPGMREADRERFVAKFRTPRAAATSLVGLCVLGGIFGESIDLPGESLVGVVVVGTGMPVTTGEREVIREHFDTEDGKGFAYAYTYPGMSKVLQAAGRLIRTDEDRGVVLLLDDRFLEPDLQQAFPKEWGHVQTCMLQTLPRLLRSR